MDWPSVLKNTNHKNSEHFRANLWKISIFPLYIHFYDSLFSGHPVQWECSGLVPGGWTERGHWARLRQREDIIVILTTCSDYCILPELTGKLEIKLNQPENVNFSNIYWTQFLTLIHFGTWNSRKLKVGEN